jgi:alkylation response protein AidB-like acyl-CoA dehydrogenase
MSENKPESLRTLPGDDVRQIMWRYTDRFDCQMLIQSARGVARGPVARLVAEGGRNTHEWTKEKDNLFKAYDEAGLTAAFFGTEYGGISDGPKNLLGALIGFELAWVDAGSATASMASNLAYAPIHEKGTPEQVAEYSRRLVPNGDGPPLRGAFVLTEPLPYVGVDTGTLCGKIRVEEWEDGQEPMIHVDKRGRFITNMDTAGFAVAAVESEDDRIKGSCMIILEETDEGTYDRGAPTLKLVHQLSSTRDPVFSLKVPASRIVGGYTIQDGKVVPNFNHGEVIEAVFRRTRVPVALMSSAKVLSAVEPVIRYQRSRFRGSASVQPGSGRYDLGLQQREDVLHRLTDIWAMGEASASLGFAAARLLDEFDPIEEKKDEILEAQGVTGSRSKARALRQANKDALEYLELKAQPEEERDSARYEELQNDTLVQYMMLESVSNILVPAAKLWNTGQGATTLREAVTLMGGYGITEDCPGFLTQKWTDAQLEATYEGPESVQRRQLTMTMTMDLFLAQFRLWITEMRQFEGQHPRMGACALAQAMELWLWTLEHLQGATDGHGTKLYRTPRQGVTFTMADALSWLVGVRQQMLDVIELADKGPQNPVVAEGLEGLLGFMRDLCRVQTTKTIGEVGRICAELVYAYNTHGEECCHLVGNKDELKTFGNMRMNLDMCTTGSRLAKDRAARALTEVMIPEALDYPM